MTPVAMLRFLMEQHGLTQAGLPEIGSQGVVSEIINGKRELNVRQIMALAGRFQVPPGVFIRFARKTPSFRAGMKARTAKPSLFLNFRFTWLSKF